MLSVIIGKNRQKFSTNKGVPQDDDLASKLSILHLDQSLRLVTKRFCPNNEQNYSSRPDLLPFHVEYADVQMTSILFKPDQKVAELITEVKKIFEEFHLTLNEEKTEINNITKKPPCLYKKAGIEFKRS